MSDEPALTSEEVSALMAELGEADATKSFGGDVRTIALGQESFQPNARLAGLERIGEKLAQRIRLVVEPFARARVQIVADPARTMRFEEWRQELPGFTSVSLYRLRPFKGGTLVMVEPDLVLSLVDAFYGGSGTPTKHKAREFTPTEERLLSRLTDGIVDQLVEVWSEVAALTPVFVSRETNAAYVSLVRGDEAVVVQRFTLTPTGGRATTVTIVQPLASLRPYDGALGAKIHDEQGPADAEWRARLAEALEGVRLPVRSVLARPELTVQQLLALKAGDVIPITLAPTVPLIVANRRMAYGTIGEREGRAAIMIEHVEGVERK